MGFEETFGLPEFSAEFIAMASKSYKLLILLM